MLMAVVAGCASFPGRRSDDVLAVVNGEPIMKGDLAYALEVAHRKEELSKGGALDLSDYVQNLVEDKLIVQEARRMGLERDPAVQQKLRAYEVREAVVRLHKEEVLDKVAVTDEEIMDYYNETLEIYNLLVVKTETREAAEEALEKINGGADFVKVVEEYSTLYDDEAGDVKSMPLSERSLLGTPKVAQAVFQLEEGQATGIIEEGDGSFYIVKYLNKQDPPEADLEHIKKRMKKAVLDEKTRERESQYLEELRAKADIEVNEELFKEISAEPGKWENDATVLARVFDQTFTAADMAARIKNAKPGRTKRDLLENWINVKVVDHEALSRNYLDEPDVKTGIERYKEQLLKNAFYQKAVFPKISVTDEAVHRYYEEHPEEFLKPARYKLMQITVEDEAKAAQVLEDLRGGAAFSWVAKTRSVDAARERGGYLGWRTEAELAGELRAVVRELQPGQLSPVVKVGKDYRIIRLQEKDEGEVWEFAKVKESAGRACFRSQFESIRSEYVSQLMEGADIKVNDAEAVSPCGMALLDKEESV
ncbi:MAG: peptidyl-prolyl cis-trans isomerase [Nitrospirota bacterium]